MAANAESSAVLTWPQGNAFLADLLYQPCKKNIRTNNLVTSVSLVNGKVHVISLDTVSNECTEYICGQVVLSCPQYVNDRIMAADLKTNRQSPQLFEYTPWIVANITVTDLPEYSGEPLSWDNVIKNSPSLGYVNACHQHLNVKRNGLVLTYYLPLTGIDTKQARKQLREKTHAQMAQEIIKDLGKAHKDIEKYITNIDIKTWGHGMIKPKPDFIFNAELKKYAAPVHNKIFFAHTDLAGISIFEEAFAQGTEAATQLIQLRHGVSEA